MTSSKSNRTHRYRHSYSQRPLTYSIILFILTILVLLLFLMLPLKINAYNSIIDSCYADIDPSLSLSEEEQFCTCMDNNFEDKTYEGWLGYFEKDWSCVNNSLSYDLEKYISSNYPSSNLTS